MRAASGNGRLVGFFQRFEAPAPAGTVPHLQDATPRDLSVEGMLFTRSAGRGVVQGSISISPKEKSGGISWQGRRRGGRQHQKRGRVLPAGTGQFSVGGARGRGRRHGRGGARNRLPEQMEPICLADGGWRRWRRRRRWLREMAASACEGVGKLLRLMVLPVPENAGQRRAVGEKLQECTEAQQNARADLVRAGRGAVQ